MTTENPDVRLDLEGNEIEIKYVQVYIPNPSVYPDKKFPSFVEMMENCPLLRAASNEADRKGVPFTPYTTTSVLIAPTPE